MINDEESERLGEFNRSYLMVILLDELIYSVIDENTYSNDFDQFEYNNEIFEICSDRFLGFHDWLRNESGNIIGIRCTGMNLGHKIKRNIRHYKYLSVTDESWSSLKIFFKNKRGFKKDKSNDQEFISSVFVSKQDHVSFLFALPIKQNGLAMKRRDYEFFQKNSVDLNIT